MPMLPVIDVAAAHRRYSEPTNALSDAVDAAWLGAVRALEAHGFAEASDFRGDELAAALQYYAEHCARTRAAAKGGQQA